VTTGPYRLVRHPGYAASCLVWIGAALAFDSWLAAAIVAAMLLVAYGWRIRAEETMLESTFGTAYRDYEARSRRLIPWVY
jgi:protein-S-isoprenylcysteine O-methyltransferase Ste14